MINYKVVYHTHGAETFHQQVCFSALSLLHLLLESGRNDIKIYIFTDKPEAAPKHELINVMPLSKDELKNFIGDFDYVHRIKIQILKRVEEELKAPLIYVDGDTKWLRLPEITPETQTNDQNVCYMHEDEGPISDTCHPDYPRLLDENKAYLKEKSIETEPRPHMWNAGVIGVPYSSDFFAQAIEINDTLFPLAKKRTWVEQLAVSITAQSRFEVKPFSKYIGHYWNNSQQFSKVVEHFFANIENDLSVESLAAKCASFPIEQALADYKLSLADRFKKWRSKMRQSLAKRKVSIKARYLKSQA